MRNKLPLSALLSSLLATPLVAAPLIRPQDHAAPIEQSAPAPVLSPEHIDQIRTQLALLAQGQPLNNSDMQRFHRRLIADVQQRIDRAQPQPRLQSRTEPAAFLGITTSAPPSILREQLNLPRGMGLVVDYIEKDSPAEAAGFKVHDILQKLDDQWLINPPQLAVLVRAKKPGDSIPLTVIRGGKELTLSAKLAEKQLPILEDMQDPFFSNPNLAPLDPRNLRGQNMDEGFPRPPALSLHMDSSGTSSRTLIDDQNDITLNVDKDNLSHLLIKDRAGKTVYDGPADKATLPANLQAKVDDLKRRPTAVTIRSTDKDGKPFEAGSDSFTMQLGRTDDDHLIQIRIDGKGRTLFVKEQKSGKTLFDGPMPPDEELKKLPPDLLPKIKALTEKATIDPH